MKSKLLLGTILLLVLLSACGGGNNADKTVSPDENLDVRPSESQPSGEGSLQPTTEPSASCEMTQEVDSITYANIAFKEDDKFVSGRPGERSFLPISCVYQGEELLKGDFYGDFEGWENAQRLLGSAPSEDVLELVDVKEHMFVGPQRPTYGFDWAATSGDWVLFPEKVTYTSYDLEHQPQEPEWTEYFLTLLKEADIDSPVVILDSWAFQWGGVESVIVTATNVVTCEDGYTYHEVGDEPISRALPVNEAPGIYLFSALFRNGQEPMLLSSRKDQLPLEWDSNYSLAAPPDGNTYSRSISSVQYDESRNLALFTVYCGHVGTETIRNYWYPPEYLLCDRDGDGEVELFDYTRSVSSLYGGYCLYKLVSNVPVLDYTRPYYHYIVY